MVGTSQDGFDPIGTAAGAREEAGHSVGAAAEPRSKNSRSRAMAESRSPYFMLVFFTVTAITVSAIFAAVILANMWSTPTADQQTVFESVVWLYRIGFGTIIVLLEKAIVLGEGVGRKLAEAIRIALL
jgi:hypothetical protein